MAGYTEKHLRMEFSSSGLVWGCLGNQWEKIKCGWSHVDTQNRPEDHPPLSACFIIGFKVRWMNPDQHNCGVGKVCLESECLKKKSLDNTSFRSSIMCGSCLGLREIQSMNHNDRTAWKRPLHLCLQKLLTPSYLLQPADYYCPAVPDLRAWRKTYIYRLCERHGLSHPLPQLHWKPIIAFQIQPCTVKSNQKQAAKIIFLTFNWIMSCQGSYFFTGPLFFYTL